MDTFPVYLLRLDNAWQIVLPDNKADVGHVDFWEQTVSRIVANHYRIPPTGLANLAYCQRRARIVGTKIYYGEQPDAELLTAIRDRVGNDQLVFVHDDHEKRLKEDVRQFKRLVRRGALSDRNPR
jgi:hypothetical protein